MSYITIRGRWCDVIVLNVHASTEDKIDDMNDSFYRELERVFHKFHKCYLTVLLGDFNAKVGREDIFQPIIKNDSLNENATSNDTGIRAVNFATSKNMTVKSTIFPHCSIHKCTWTSDGKTHNQIAHILIGMRRQSIILDVRSFRGTNCDNDHYLAVAKVRERLVVSKQTTHKFHMKRLNLMKLNEVKGKKQD
jgi:hypothetical protein